ncbi:MAG: SiaC family regulatory phosphoprotein, partial [Bacteroidales bacterium]|nr:SiaC family regulatory phosphoprotein [Bacteroidales bacterium]
DGVIKIKGRGLFSHKTKLPAKVLAWLDNYLEDPAETTDVVVAFEYLNSFSTRVLTSIFQKVKSLVLKEKKFVIHWYYESDDEDIFERGEYIASTLDIPVQFVVISDISTI